MPGAPRDTARAERRVRLGRADGALAAFVLVASAIGSLWLGQDLSFDLLSYHYYNGYAFVAGRLDRDIAPTGWHTYISPALDALNYLGMTRLPPRGFGFAFGALHGLNVVLVCLLALACLAGAERPRLVAGCAALVAALGPNAVSLLGTTAGNNLVSIPTLLALVVLAWPLRDAEQVAPEQWPAGRLVLAAALAGAASGMRLTAAVDHVALVAVVLLLVARGRDARRLLVAGVALGVGSVAGFLAANGVWCVRLWERFGNPLFPFANQLFRSPFFAPVFWRDERFVARTALDYLRPPLDLTLGHTERLQEIGARDARYLALAIAALAAAAAFAASRRSSSARPRLSLASAQTLVLGFALVDYALWAKVFYYHRYMTTLELVAPVALVVLLGRLVPPRALAAAALCVSLALVFWSRTSSWGRGDWQSNWFGLELPALAHQPGSLVLMTGGPISFALPYFPADARFMHLTAIRDKGGTELFDRAMAEAIASHQGPLLLLSSFRVDSHAQDPATRRPRWVYNAEEDAGPVARRFGLRLTDRCEDMRTRRGPLYLCEVEKADAAAP